MINEYISQIENFTNIQPVTVLEIGALDGEYSEIIKERFSLEERNVYLVEPREDLHPGIRKRFPGATIIPFAISNKEEKVILNKVVSSMRDYIGSSSLLDRVDGWTDRLEYEQVEVPAITGRTLLEKINKPVDICIIDVEGLAYEVLESLGSKISMIKSVMIETEHVEIFKGQKLYADVCKLLELKGFKQMSFKYSYANQSDSVWVQEKYLALSSDYPDKSPLPIITPDDIEKKLDIRESTVPVRRDEAEFIYQFLIDKGIKKTMEVGLAYGRSASYIMAATQSRHIAMDPYQRSYYQSLALKNIEKLGMRSHLEFYQDMSHTVLPKLLSEGRKFEFIFIDGDHRFDGILLDFYYADLMVEKGGYVLLHDAWMRSTILIEEFLKTNRKDYKHIKTPIKSISLFHKVDQDRRDGMHFEEFYTRKGKLIYPLFDWYYKGNASITKKYLRKVVNFLLKGLGWELIDKSTSDEVYKVSDHRIQISQPKNLLPEDESIYEPHWRYSVAPLVVKHLNEVFVTYTGLCKDDNGLIEECHQNYSESIPTFEKEVNRYYQLAEDEGNVIVLDNDSKYLVIHHPWNNLHHWMLETIPKLWQVKEDLKDLILIFPETWTSFEYMLRSLEPFQFKEILSLPYECSLMVRNLVLPQTRPMTNYYDPKLMNEISDFYVDFVTDNGKSALDLGPRVWVKTKDHVLGNEAEARIVLEKYGFRVMETDQYTLYDKISIFSKARFVVGCHDPEMSSVFFMPRGSHYLEFLEKNGDALNIDYWYLSVVKEQGYYYQAYSKKDKGLWSIDIAELEANLKLMLAEASTSN